MTARTYFLVNDTRYDNHHGGLTVVRNLHAGMAARGWRCTGSIPVSSCVRHLARRREALRAARLVVVNGEGSLHHDSRNSRRLFSICRALTKTHRLVLINALWQDNDAVRWTPLLQRISAVYARDRRSQTQLKDLGIEAGVAPDLTFYDYPVFPAGSRSGYLCTDSVVSSWTEAALQWCREQEDVDFITLFTGTVRYARGARDWHKRIKCRLYPWLEEHAGVTVPPRYRALPYALQDTGRFLQRLAACRAVCAARYHALCFALQQKVPFVAVASNSHKSEALLEDVGLPVHQALIPRADLPRLRGRLEQAAAGHLTFQDRIEAFNRSAREQIDRMFDHIAGVR